MTCGVPQGSVLGPILFIIYINDICNVSDVVKCVLFADDTNIFCSERNLTDLQLTLNHELGKLFVWFSVNKLSLNLSKTNYILFRNRSADTDLNIRINTINVTRVQSSKFLGIIIDENLNWKPHIQLVKSILSKTLSIIYKASKLINYEGMLTLYCSLFLPYLTYCCEIWGNTYATNVNCIYVIQKKVVRIIHHEERLAHTNCLYLSKCTRSNFKILLNTEQPSLCLNYITVNCLHCYNPDLSEVRIFTTLVAGTHLL